MLERSSDVLMLERSGWILMLERSSDVLKLERSGCVLMLERSSSVFVMTDLLTDKTW